ncbi:IS5 family transposase [Candidatus Woesearchaeota archaeon]|nr:IS5 family transposase [Candidatus Woesearchaeota archaeon]
MKIIQNKYKKVSDLCYELFKIAELPLYASKFSNKLYSQFQHLFMLIYKQFRRFTYEELLTDIASNKEFKAYLGMNKIPHYTTLIKFAQRLPCKIFDKLVLAFKGLIPDPKKVAIDGTGISLDNASLHYCKRIGKPAKKRPFMKTTFIVDIENYFILLVKMRKRARHDTKDAKPMIKKLAEHYNPEILYGDRGYDFEEIFELCFETLNAYPLILQKNLNVPKWRRSGRYRKETYDVFDYGEYLQRNKIETLNSMIKRRFGSNVKSHKDKLQRVDIYSRVIAFNIDRMLRMSEKIILIFIRIMRVSY